MKKLPIKRLLAILLVATLSITLSACSGDKYNTEAPYGTLSGNYATNGSTTLTNVQLYDMLRPGGYNVFYNKIEEIILSDYLNDISWNDDNDQEEMFELLNTKVFNTDDIDEINDISADDLELMFTQLTDSLYTAGVYFDTDDIDITSEGVTYPEELFDYFKLDLAKERFGEFELQAQIDKGEEYEEEDEDGEMQTIENAYYISEDDVENYYNSTYVNTQDYNAVIIGFNSIADYETAMGNITITENNVAASYISLYNNAFAYKQTLTSSNLLENTIVNVDKLSVYNSSLVSFLNNMEAKQFTTSYKEFGDKVYMLYKINDIADDKWEDLSDTEDIGTFDGETLNKSEVETKIREILFDTKLTSSFINNKITEKVTELIEEDKIEIYDPVFGLIFATSFEDFEYNLDKLPSQENVAKIDGTAIKVDDLFDTLSQYFGVETAMNYFINAALANSDYINQLDDDDIEAAQDGFDAEIEKFENDEYASNGVTKVFTEEQFLSMMFGYDNEGDVIKYYFETQEALQYVTSTYNDNYFELLSLIGQNNYNNYFSLDIKHVLLYVDYDLDGTMDDPADFMNELSDADKEKFEETIVNIYTAIYNEVSYLELGYEDGLDFIAKAYNQNRDLVAPDNSQWANWDEVKNSEGINFNIQIKVESLGTVDTSNASSYVSEFSDHVLKMYETLLEETKDLVSTDVDSDDYLDDLLDEFEDYLDQDHLEKITTFDNLCMSTFGFHMLLSTGGSIASSAEFLESSDYKTSSSNDYKVYEHIEIYLDGEDSESKVVNAYSDTAYPSINQLQIYVAEMNTDDGIENLKSATETIINGFYSTFTSRFTNTTFVNYYLYLELEMNVEFNDSVNDDMVEQYYEISKRNLDSYEDTSSTSNHTYAGMWEKLEELFTTE